MIAQQSLTQLVVARADNRCEYCGMHQSLQGATFHIEHILPRSSGGATVADNRALACPGCNLRKSDRTEAIDSQTGLLVPLFNPRKNEWIDHFAWVEFRVEGVTDTGRATVELLDLNHHRRLWIREVETMYDLFPPS